MHETPMTDSEIRQDLAPGEPGDDLVMATVIALRSAGHTVAVEEAGGTGPREAYVVAEVDGRRMKLSAQPW